MFGDMEDKEWQARCDAEALARAQFIKSDKVRYAAAKKAAGILINEQKKKISAMNEVAGGKSQEYDRQVSFRSLVDRIRG